MSNNSLFLLLSKQNRNVVIEQPRSIVVTNNEEDISFKDERMDTLQQQLGNTLIYNNRKLKYIYTNINSNYEKIGIHNIEPEYTLDVSGDMRVTSDLKVVGHTDLNNVSIHSNLSLGGDMNVSGGIDVTGDISGEGNLEIKGNISSDGNLDLSGNIDISGNLNVWGKTHLHGDISGCGRLDVRSNVNTLGDYLINQYIMLPVGTIIQYVVNTPPDGWLLCDGSLHQKDLYPRLYNIIGTKFGGVSGVSFRVPNFSGRVGVGYNTTDTSFNSIGFTGGERTHRITVSEMPAHNHEGNTKPAGKHAHTIEDKYFTGNQGADGDPRFYTTVNNGNNYELPVTKTTNENQDHTHAFDTSVVGESKEMDMMQPYIVINYIIRY